MEMMWLKNVLNKIKEAIYPNKCILCRNIINNHMEQYICEKCSHKILYQDFSKDIITVDGDKYNIDKKLESQDKIQKILPVFKYEGIVRHSIRRWKYRGIRKYAKGYADLMVNELGFPIIFDIDGFIPVPISRKRGIKRGFNQAYDLALEMSRLTGIKTYDCLTRIKETKAQSKCTNKERMSNINNTIKLKRNFELPELKNIAIIDDIYTTGSTTKECIRALMKEYAMKDTKFYIMVVSMGG